MPRRLRDRLATAATPPAADLRRALVISNLLRFDPPHALEFEWGERGIPSTVLFELHETAHGTQLRLTHARQALEMARRTGAGWHAHLDLFEAALIGDEVKWEDAYAAAVPRYADSLGS